MHLGLRLLLLALLCLTVVPGRMSLVVRAHHRHHSHHPHRSSPIEQLTLPECARPAFRTEALTVGCTNDTARCLCKKPEFFHRLLAAITKSCAAAEQAAVLASVEQYCGINLIVPVTTSTRTVTKTPVKTTSHLTVPKTPAIRTKHTVHHITTKTSLTKTKGSSTPTRTHGATTSHTQSSSATASTHPTKGKTPLGDAGRLEAGLGVAALGAVVVAMGWIFDEF